jgi:CubicO group peptidase (beta-lactamase class C family)
MERPASHVARCLAPLLLAAAWLAAPAVADAAPAPAPSCWPTAPAGWQGVRLVSHEGQTVVRADGTADGRPLTPETRFNIASLGKMFTAVAVGQLVDRGLLRFDDPVGRHLPELPPAFRALTIAQLLSHTGGLGDYMSEAPPETVAAARSATDLLPLVLTRPPRNVGSWDYSNSGYALAGAIAERVTGHTLQALLETRIFAPAGMTAVGFAPGPGDALPTVVGPDGQPTHPAVGRIAAGPPGGHFATAADMARFGHALLSGKLLKPDTLARMSSLHIERLPPGEDGRPRGWGLGFGVTGAGETRMFGHVGGVPGGGGAMRLLPKSGRIVLALANQDRVPAPSAAAQLLQVDPGTCTTPERDPA